MAKFSFSKLSSSQILLAIIKAVNNIFRQLDPVKPIPDLTTSLSICDFSLRKIRYLNFINYSFINSNNHFPEFF